tara:strand:+ start:5859 stop:7736 length:1878 start_codon:yes stop_codon:yes gene_type:complete
LSFFSSSSKKSPSFSSFLSFLSSPSFYLLFVRTQKKANQTANKREGAQKGVARSVIVSSFRAVRMRGGVALKVASRFVRGSSSALSSWSSFPDLSRYSYVLRPVVAKTTTLCGFASRPWDIGRSHHSALAAMSEINKKDDVDAEEEEEIDVPEGLKLNAIRVVQTAYETCAKAHHTEEGKKMTTVLAEATAEQFVRERIESKREGNRTTTSERISNTENNNNNERRREYLKAIAEDIKLASKLISKDFNVCKRALVEGTLTLRDVAEMSRRAKEDHQWRKTVIRSVHTKLRDGAKANEEDLQQYSKAAAATGKSKWVKNVLTWSFQFFEHYFGKIENEIEHLGVEDGRQYAKSRRKLITSLGEDVGKLAPTREALYRGKRKRDGSSGKDEETARIREMRNASIERNRRYARLNRSNSGNRCGTGNDNVGEAFRLLDVGSCWDFYREYEHSSTYFGRCKVFAFDLAPENGANDVLEGDFLNVQFFDHIEDDNGTEVLLKKSTSSSKQLEGLQMSSFNVVVLSLVLTYVPTPEKRFQMIINARKCLKGDGDGLLMIIEPHGFDKSKENLVAKTWQKSIESVGFNALVNSKTRDGLHVLIFETTSSLPLYLSERRDRLVMALDEKSKK